MAENLEQFCLADPLHFRALRDWCPEWDIGLAAGKNFDEEGWDVREFDVWRVYTPPGRVVVAQGWKIHVSATAESAGDALERIARICRAHEVAFKHLVTLAAVVASCSRSSARASAGKFIVLYPEDEAVFLEVVAECAEAVAGLAGPYVLTDRQWEPHSPVFFRYGAFQPQQVWTSSGTRAPARASADGLVPDERSVPYRTPIGVSVPEEIRRRSQPVALDAELPVRFVEAVQHSACGGVYRAVDRTTGRALIVKEARPHTGESPRLPSAVERLSHEARVLADTDGVHAPLLRHVFEVDGHRFLAIDEVLGQPLRGWVASRHPMLSAQPSSALVSYVRDARRVTSGIRDALSAVHAAGWAHNDVHPGNVIVRDDLSVALIDFEFATALDDVRRPGMHCGGFARAGGPAVERDLFAVTMIEGWLMHPGLGAQLELLPETGLVLVDEARTWFGGREEVATAVAAYESHGYRAPVVERTGHRLTTPPSSPHRDQYISYLRAVASPERAVLFPGHATAYASPLDALALAHGTAGVLTALQTAGEPIDVEWGDHFRAAASAPVRTAGSPGLWDGWAGIAATMASLGDHAAARHAVGRVADALEGCTDPTLWSGLAGAVVGLSLAAEQTADRDTEELTLSTLDRLAASPLLWQSRTSKPGLMHGPSGVAAVLASATGRFPYASGRELWLEAARELLAADVQRCTHVAGVRQLVDRGVALPYLGEGSLGVALARMALRHAEGSTLTALDEELARSGMLELIVEPGLVYGRLGVQLAMSLLIDEKAPELSLSLRTWVTRHGELLRSGCMGVDGGVAILGRGTGRICADLATGAAGALAVGAALDGTSVLLPSLLGLGLASRPLALVTPTGHRPV